MEITGCNHRRG